VPFGQDPSDSSGGSRTFLLRVAAVLGLIIAGVAVATYRGSGDSAANSTSTSSVGASTSVDIARLAPSTSSPPTASNVEGAPVPTLPEDALPELGLATPQSAARNLWDSWRDRDRPRALLYASPGAVDRLFDWTWVPQVRQAGCTPIEAGWLCRFEGPKQRWDSSIDGDPVRGYRVVGLRIGDPVGDVIAPDSLPTVTNLTPITGPDGSPTKLGPSVPRGLEGFETTTSIPVTNPDGSPAELPEDLSSTSTSNAVTDAGSTVSSSKPRKRPSTTVRKKPKRTTTVANQSDGADPGTPEPAPERPAQPAPDKPAQPAEEPPAPADNGPVPVEGGTTPVPS
jgi:hypothetical protein